MNRKEPATRVYRAPGRVNLIGEHTDYNEGLVMPAAIDLYTQVGIKARGDRKLVTYSEAFSETVEFDLDDPVSAGGHWSDYVFGVAVTLERAGYELNGAELTIRSNVPIGAGLGSSAAIEVASALALLENFGVRIGRVELAKLCQRAENEFVGLRCGIMDQFISCLAQAGSALLLDCRSLAYRLAPVPEEVRLVVCNTMVQHELCVSEYNARRAECEAAARQIAKSRDNVKSLRDVTLNDLERVRDDLGGTSFKRCRHVITENARVVQAAAALERADLSEFGMLMGESHRSLRDDYEISCDELDVMVDLATRLDGVYGARMTGAGFGGCTINLVAAYGVSEFRRRLAEGYRKATGLTPEIYICSTADGAVELTS